MKHHFANFVLILFLIGQISYARSSEINGDVQYISIASSGNWELVLRRDQLFVLRFGEGTFDFARGPKETFNLEEVYTTLTPHIKPQKEEDCVAVSIATEGVHQVKIQYIPEPLSRPFFEKAIQFAIPFNEERFEFLLNEHPLFVNPE